MKVEVFGSKELIARINKVSETAQRNMKHAISLRTNSIREEVHGLLSSPPRTGIERGGRSAGTGKQVGPTGEAAIGIRSGRLINSLTSVTSQTSGGRLKFSGEIGFPNTFKVSNPAKVKRYALNWPRQNVKSSQVVNTGTAPAKDKRANKKPVQEYAEQAILGTTKIAGRNVLRMSMIEDIRKSSTLNQIARFISMAFKAK